MLCMYGKCSKISKTSCQPKLPRQTVQTHIKLLLQGLPRLLFWQAFCEFQSWQPTLIFIWEQKKNSSKFKNIYHTSARLVLGLYINLKVQTVCMLLTNLKTNPLEIEGTFDNWKHWLINSTVASERVKYRSRDKHMSTKIRLCNPVIRVKLSPFMMLCLGSIGLSEQCYKFNYGKCSKSSNTKQ